MHLPPISPLLDRTLRDVDRRYRLPEVDSTPLGLSQESLLMTLAMVIEQARMAVEEGRKPAPALKGRFIAALAQMIRDAMQGKGGDPAFQAMVLRHQRHHVREYASLSAGIEADRRQLWGAVNALAHPGKLQRMPSAVGDKEAFARLRSLALDAAWPELANAASQLLAQPKVKEDTALEGNLLRILDAPGLARLRRHHELASDSFVCQYRAFWNRQGPASGSYEAAAQGAMSRRRGDSVEAVAAQALEAWAERLNAAEGAEKLYRVVTSLRVPSSLSAGAHRAKTEWDVVLLRRADTANGSVTWDVCLLVEAKASVDAAATDLPRLVRGLRLLAQAEADVLYSFRTRQGELRLRGASLKTLIKNEADLWRTVLYCSDAPAVSAPRLLNAASRMQLLSAPASLDFAAALAEARPVDPDALAVVWDQLLVAPRWRAVLHQYATLRQARELMVHTEDLLAAI